jgi:hypothetical protein
MDDSVRSRAVAAYRGDIRSAPTDEPRPDGRQRTSDPTPEPGPSPSPSPAIFAVLLGSVALPFVVSAVALAATGWTPAGDQAVQVLRIEQVGTSRTPLVGAWSRWGWNHPGPWPSYILAPFTQLFGATGALIGTLMVNMASLLLAVVVARRRGGLVAAALVALLGMLMAFGQGPTVLMDLWNPFVGLFPFYALVVMVWSLSDRDWVVLPLATALASFCVQAHIGFVPVVVALCTIGLLAAIPDPGGRTEPAGPARDTSTSVQSSWRRPAAWSVVVLVIAWAPPVFEQLRSGEGNVSRLLRYARDSPEDPVGWSMAWRVFATELGLPGAWLTGREFDMFAPVDSPVGAIAVVSATVVLGVLSLRAGAWDAARLSLIAVVATVAAFVATSRITGYPFDYLLVWWWPVGATLWLSMLWSVWNLLRPRSDAVVQPISRFLVAATMVVAAVLAVRTIGAEMPVARQGETVRSLLEAAVPQLDADDTYRVEWRLTRGFGYVGVGVFVDLSRRGFDVVVPTAEGIVFEPQEKRDQADHRIVITTPEDDRYIPPPAGSRPLARFDPLDGDERTEFDELWSEIERQAPTVATGPIMFDSLLGRLALADAGVDPAVLERFTELWDKGPAFTLYLAPGPVEGG